MRNPSVWLLVFLLVFSWTSTTLAEPPYPDDFPEAFPQYQDCDMVQVMNFPDNKSAMLSCGDTPMEKVYGFYLSRARGDGWEVLMENKSSDYMIFMVEKASLAMQVQVLSEKGTTQLGLSLVRTD